MRGTMTRRKFIVGGVAVVGAAAASTGGVLISNATSSKKPPRNENTSPGATATAGAGAAAQIPPYSGLRSRPDFDGVATLKVLKSTGAAQGGFLFVTPKTAANVQGSALYDNDGHLVWYRPMSAGEDMVHNLQVVQYKGESLLALYEGKAPSGTPGFGDGAYLLFNNKYEQTAIIKGEDGSPIDLHELVVTPQGTALVGAYIAVKKDLSAYGGAKDTTVYDWRLQEIDIATGKLLFSWRALDHVAIAETTEKPPSDPGGSFDYFHGNSIALHTDNKHFIVSARNTSTIYKIDRTTGDIAWRLRGADTGKAPGKTIKLLPEGETFWYQHDARSWPDGTLSMLDDGGQPFHHNGRGLLLAIDEDAGTATVQRHDTINKAVNFEGSYRPQSNGDWLAGWGDIGGLTEFATDGSIVLDIDFDANSYRCIRADWTGAPVAPPDIAAERGIDGKVNAWASWNGATDVASWRVLAGNDTSALSPVGDVAPRQDFETAMTVATNLPVIAVEALDANGKSLGVSAPRTV